MVLSLNSWHDVPSTGYKIPKCNILYHCGTEFIALLSNVKKRGNTKSCGCLRLNDPNKHYQSESNTYHSWETMVQRCTNPNNTNYYRYGGDGIIVVDRWLTEKGGGFLNFLEDMGERPEGTTLNRVGSVKVYSKETCEWATNAIQAFDKKINKRSKTGVAGVRRNAADTKWRVTISFNKKEIPIGMFEDFKEAVEVRQKAELQYYGFIISNLGESYDCAVDNR